MFNNAIISEYKNITSYDVSNYNPISNNKIAIIVETRKLDYLDWVVDTIKHFIGWEIRFFCSHMNKDMVSGVQKSIIPNKIDYSSIMKDSSFWSDIDQEHILVFQHDSFVLREGIDEFLQYDYIGAPWDWSYNNSIDRRYKNLKDFRNGGNGGFSLRKKSAMLELSSGSFPDYEYEDMYFSNALKNDIPLEIKQKFAVESIFYENPLGVHKIDKYLSDEQIKKILFK